MIPEAAVEALARVLADEALFDADCSGSGWNAETDSSDHFMPRARKRALDYLEAGAPHMLAEVLESAAGDVHDREIGLYPNAIAERRGYMHRRNRSSVASWLRERADKLRPTP